MQKKNALPKGYLAKLAKVVNPALIEMGAKIREYFNNSATIAVSYKKTNIELDVQTNVDAEVELYLYEVIHKKFPEIGFQLEEHAQLNDLSKEIVCAIDPVDGTRNFSRQLPNFVCQIGFSYQGKAVAGHIIDPISNRLYFGSQEQPATLNNKSIRVSEITDLDLACISAQVTTRRSHWLEEQERIAEIYSKLLIKVAKIRNFGTTGWHLANIAAGNLEAGAWLTTENAYDVVAGIALVEAAGGLVEQFEIEQLMGKRMVAGNPELVRKLKELLLS